MKAIRLFELYPDSINWGKSIGNREIINSIENQIEFVVIEQMDLLELPHLLPNQCFKIVYFFRHCEISVINNL